MNRRRVVSLLMIALGLSLLAGAAEAAWQPDKPVEIIAPSGPGGGWDRTARGAQKILTEEKLVPQPIVV
ncbi:MAG: tripartite tricarboxylate transporter substrate binding protein, partial [candidate division NC10 bacterium]|nr:tripartite tricarboxylate transporter substrate binding protein [candidate division NC10 bacterium]